MDKLYNFTYELMLSGDKMCVAFLQRLISIRDGLQNNPFYL